MPLVQVDNRMGARLATEHLLALGHTRIAHIAGAPARISEERLLGYQGALSQAGLAPTPRSSRSAASPRRGGHDAMQALLAADAGVTAVFAANDLSAIGAINAIAASGRSVPGDVSVVGFDDLRLARYTSPPLTTVRQPAGEIARHSTELLLGMIAGRQPGKLHHLFPPELDRSRLDRAASSDVRRHGILDDSYVSAYCKRLLMEPGARNPGSSALRIGVIGAGRIGVVPRSHAAVAARASRRSRSATPTTARARRSPASWASRWPRRRRSSSPQASTRS